MFDLSAFCLSLSCQKECSGYAPVTKSNKCASSYIGSVLLLERTVNDPRPRHLCTPQSLTQLTGFCALTIFSVLSWTGNDCEIREISFQQFGNFSSPLLPFAMSDQRRAREHLSYPVMNGCTLCFPKVFLRSESRV